MSDAWDPTQYDKFRTQRLQPFFDLAALIHDTGGMRAIDLGCGTGEITALLADRFVGSQVEGIDSSSSMLERAAERAKGRLSFRLQSIEETIDLAPYDLVFSNAALQWVEDHERLIPRLLERLKPGAQIAFQMPRNEAHPSHTIAAAVAAEPAFAKRLGGFLRESPVLPLERYAALLHRHGFDSSVCVEKIYGHLLDDPAEVVEWVKGTLLTPYLARLDGAGRDAFLDRYRALWRESVGDQAPYYYAFRRVLLWGRRARS